MSLYVIFHDVFKFMRYALNKMNVVYYLAFRKRKDDQHLGGRAP